MCYSFFFFNDTATTEIYTLSLHDALPILKLTSSTAWTTVRSRRKRLRFFRTTKRFWRCSTSIIRRKRFVVRKKRRDRKSTRLNSSHGYISYAVFCLKKKKHIIT